MKQIEATILGQSYMLACPPDGETQSAPAGFWPLGYCLC